MPAFQIFTEDEIELLRKGGSVLRNCLVETATHVKPGITTGHLDYIAECFIRSHNSAVPAFKGYNNFPATLCTSVNEQCVHGIPGSRTLLDGDIISLDCGVIYGGLYTDACITVAVGSTPADVRKFISVSAEALDRACGLVAPGVKIGDVSSAIQQHVEGHGYSCVNGLTGHGLGTALHQFPDVPNTGKAGTGPTLPVNTMIAVEPITAMGGPGIRDDKDEWTISTKDGSLSAHFEHTVLITSHGCEILA